MKRTLSILAVIAWGMMTACNKMDNNTEPQTLVAYTVSIPATIGSDVITRAVEFDNSGSTPTSHSKFLEGEKVYVYNATRYTMMLNAEGTAAGYLTPTNISADGKRCDLTGTITGAPIYPIDELMLMYNLNDIYAGNDKNKIRLYSHYDYMRQDGTAAGVLDGATATLTGWSISDGVLTTAGTARFVNLQSMFGLQFKDASTDAAISVKSLYITSKNDALIRLYYLMNTGTDQYYKGLVGPYINNPISGDIYMSLFFDETCSADDVLTFHVKDADGNKYEGTKAAPNGGFKNGKYYYLSAPIALTLTERRILPTITWITPSSTPETIGEEWIEIEDDNADFTLSGTSEGVCFFLYNNGTVRLNGLTASYGADNDVFISGNYDIMLDISGANSISCKNYEMCILAQDNLKLQGTGTLTVTANDATHCGIRGNANYAPANSWHSATNANDNTAEVDVSAQLAADGYTVIRSARTDNADGTYTWTYTVAPTE